MPPATAPVPTLVLESLAAAMELPDAGSDYYYNTSFVGFGREITERQVKRYPCVFIGEPNEIGTYQEATGVLNKTSLAWNVEVFGVIEDPGNREDAYRNLVKLGADIFRAAMVDTTRDGNACWTALRSMTFLGPASESLDRPWVALVFQILLRTGYDQMVTA